MERSDEAVATSIGLGGALFKATVLAAAIALPEFVDRDHIRLHERLLIGDRDIFGADAFLPIRFLLAILISGKKVLAFVVKHSGVLRAQARRCLIE